MKNLKRNASVTSFCLLICLSLCTILFAWENVKTHPAITEKAISLAMLEDYLKTQLDLNDGLSAQLYWDFPADIKKRIKEGEAEPEKTTRSILDWLCAGSIIEDEDGRYWPIRPRHHFHDPIRNDGLDNQTDYPNWEDYACTKTGFNLTGESALWWATKGYDRESRMPKYNENFWWSAREDFRRALVLEDKTYRELNLSSMFLNLGCVLHLLEDMGVPAHTRNDFIEAHYRSWYDKGNPLENWVEKKVAQNDGQSPWLGSEPAVFDKLAKYFDANEYDGDYLNGSLPPETWGLSECSNYQFLSTSTMFGCSGVKNNSCRDFQRGYYL